MSDFAGIENAKTSDRLPNLTAGCSYILRAESNKKFKSRKGETFFAAEFTIIESSGPNANAPGTQASWLVKMTGNDSALGNIKGYVAALIHEPVKNVSAAMCDELVGEDNPAAGKNVRVSTMLVPTKKGGEFTLHNFAPYSGSGTQASAEGIATATAIPATGKQSKSARA